MIMNKEQHAYFQALSEIDASYFLLGQLMEDLSKPEPPINMIIDKATGYAKVKRKQDKSTAIALLESIIKNKKKVNMDYSDAEKTLEQVKALEW